MSAPPPRGEARDRILETTWSLIAAEGAAAATLVRVAREAGVSRQAVYLFFGNRAGLLDEALRWHDAKSGIGRRFLDATRTRPSADALRAVVDTWFAYLPDIDPVARAVQAAAVTDGDAARAWDSRMDDLRGILRGVLRRIEAEGRLAPGWTVPDAVAFAFALSHADCWRHLVSEAGWTHDAAVGRVARALESALLTRPVSSPA